MANAEDTEENGRAERSEEAINLNMDPYSGKTWDLVQWKAMDVSPSGERDNYKKTDEICMQFICGGTLWGTCRGCEDPHQYKRTPGGNSQLIEHPGNGEMMGDT